MNSNSCTNEQSYLQYWYTKANEIMHRTLNVCSALGILSCYYMFTENIQKSPILDLW